MMALNISAGDSDEEEPHSSTKDKTRNSFILSQSGSFRTDDFRVNRLGMSSSLSDLNDRASSSSVGQQGSLGLATDVASLDDLEMLEVFV